MKRLISTLMVVVALVSGVQAAELATGTGPYFGVKYADERYMPKEMDAQPMHIQNIGPVLGFEYEPTVTKIELQGFYTRLQIADAAMPGMSLESAGISGLGIEFSQGIRLTKTWDVKAGGFVNYVYHFRNFSQNFVIPTKEGDYPVKVKIPSLHQLRAGGSLQVKPLDMLMVHATGGYQLQGGFLGGGASVKLGKVDVGVEYVYGTSDHRNSYTMSMAVHF